MDLSGNVCDGYCLLSDSAYDSDEADTENPDGTRVKGYGIRGNRGCKKQQKQQQSGNDTTDTSINNIEKQIKKLLN